MDLYDEIEPIIFDKTGFKLYDSDSDRFLSNKETKINLIRNEVNHNLKSIGNKLKLYRYMNSDYYAIRNFETNSIYLKNPGDFNDPFDSAVLFSADEIVAWILKNKESLIKIRKNQYISKVYDPNFQEIILAKPLNEKKLKEFIELNLLCEQFEWDSLKNLIYVCCFSTELNSTLMWSHYTNKHRGFCVEYDLSKCNRKYNKFFHPIIYNKQRYEIENKDFWIRRFFTLHKEDGITQEESRNIGDIIIASMVKSPNWEYEKEWRITIPKNIIEDEFNNNPCISFDCASAVYLGARMEPVIKKHIKEIAERKDIRVHELKLSSDSFDLIF